MDFNKLFISEMIPYKGKSQRDKFLSRVFGIFNEEIIKIWCENSESPFTNIGRPTIYDTDGRYYTLDFLLKDQDNRLYITEMKCEIEYQKYKYLTLFNSKQLAHHRKKRAFQLLLEVAKSTKHYPVKCEGKKIEVYGSAIIWGKILESEASLIKQEFCLDHILSAESIVNDLIRWNDKSYHHFINQYSEWSKSLFSGLLGKT